MTGSTTPRTSAAESIISWRRRAVGRDGGRVRTPTMAEHEHDPSGGQAPSGLPADEPEEEPLGVPEAEPEGEDEPQRGSDAMPGIPTEGDPPDAG